MSDPRPGGVNGPHLDGANGPYLLGVTGRIGSGKSLCCRLLAEAHHLPILDADAIGHEVIGPGGPARAAVVAHFGEGILDRGGEIDRRELGRRVFADAAALRQLNRLVHPALLERIAGAVASLKGAGYLGIILLDAALLPEWADRFRPDAVVLLRATPSTCVSRLEARGLSRAEAERRVAAQETLFGTGIPADWVLDNEGTVAELRSAVEALWRELTERFPSPGEEEHP